MAYPGGKDGAGVWQRIVNELPPHDVFISAFLGDCAILRRKKPAAWNIGIDLDGSVCSRFVDRVPTGSAASFDLFCCDAVEWLANAFDLDRLVGPIHADGTVGRFGVPRDRVLVYADPPYLASSRKGSKKLYRYEMSEERHRALLHVFRRLPCLLVVSHYPCDLYDKGLAMWRSFTFQAGTRRGAATEKVWLNFPRASELHDVRFLGGDKREREKFCRRRRNLMRRLLELPAVERQSILAELQG
jgi:DNA adenine methylase